MPKFRKMYARVPNTLFETVRDLGLLQEIDELFIEFLEELIERRRGYEKYNR